MSASPGPIPPHILALLTAGVLLAHGLVVHEAALGLAPPEPQTMRVFSTRLLQLRPETALAADAPRSPPAGKAIGAPPQRTKPRPHAADPDPKSPLATAASSAAAEPAPSADLADLPAASPAPVASVAQSPQEPVAALAQSPPPEPRLAAVPESPASPSTPSPPKDVTQVPRSYTVPGSMVLKFDARGQRGRLEYHATGQLVWLHDGSSYEARLELGAFLIGSRILRSTGLLAADGLAPNRYSDKFRSEVAAHFDRSRGRVTFSANTPEASLEPGAQDQLSVFVQLAAMVAGEPARFPVGTTITLQTVGPRTAEPWAFSVDAAELLALPGGEQRTLKLTRLPRREFDQKVELWLAPALGYLPARIRVTQTNGDFIDQQWRATASP